MRQKLGKRDSSPTSSSVGTISAAVTYIAHSAIPTERLLPRDLWSEAVQKLPEGDQQIIKELRSIDTAQEPLSKTMDELLGLVKTVRDDSEAKQCTFSFRGKDIIIRDMMGKTICWMNKFKEVVDVIANVDPVHFGLPWAGVKFILEVCFSTNTLYLLTDSKGCGCRALPARTSGVSN